MAQLPTNPPPPEPWWARLRRWKRNAASLDKHHYWLLTTGSWFLAAFIGVYALGGLLIGWARAYEVLIGITSPAKLPYPVLSWTVSIVGWMIVPAFIGGTVGYLLGRQIDTHRSRDLKDLEARLRKLSGISTPPSSES
jgi:uncharacterized protein DUF6313